MRAIFFPRTIVLCLCLIACWAARAEDPTKKKPVTLKPATYAKVMQQLEKNKGKIVVVHVWAQWCAPCRIGLPKFVEARKKTKHRGVVTFTISIDNESSHDTALDFLKKHDVTTTNYRYEDATSSAKTMGINAVPATLIYDRKGKEAARLMGYSSGVEKKLVGIVEDLLEKK